jgi:signal transduction histidine kinase
MYDFRSNISAIIYYSVAAIIALIIFAIDLKLPLGVADGSLYAGLALLGLLALSRNLIILGATTGTALTIAGYFFSPAGGEDWKVLTNRGISILTIWIIALICLKKRKADAELQKAHSSLESKIVERTKSLRDTNIDLKKKSNYLLLHKNIVEKVNENTNIEDIFHYCLKQICSLANAQVGHLYLSEDRYSGRLLPQKIWHIENESEFQSFKELTERHIFESGIGLPGRTHEFRRSIWIEDIGQDLNFPRRINHEGSFSVKSGFAFPIFIGNKVTGVMEFFFNKQRKSDSELLDLMEQTGVQMGRALERRFHEEDRDKILLSLKERVKELTCMSGVAKLVTVGQTMDEILSAIGNFIIPAWQFPDLTLTRTVFNGKVFGNKTFPPVPWALSTDIVVNGKTKGQLAVCYSDKPSTGAQVFLDEEINLLNWLGQTLSHTASRLENANDLKNSNTELRSLYNKLENVREKERTRIAREIHDELGQALTICKLDLTWLRSKTLDSSNEVEIKLKAMLKHIDTTLEELNRITSELRPHVLNVMGLFEALKQETEKFINLTGINGEIYLSEEIPALHPDLSTLIFRVYQETLTNISRHSNAKNFQAQFTKNEDLLILIIKDNGKGIETNKIYNSNSFGLTGMRERVKEWGGEFSINGAPGKGTQVSIKVPLLYNIHGQNE